MKNLIKSRLRWSAAVGWTAASLTAWAGWAHDLLPPCWRGQVGTTFQRWTFNTNANPASPELASNPYGSPQAEVTVGPFGAGWLWDLRFGTNRGYWDLGRGGTISISIPDDPSAPTGAWKYVWVQVTHWEDSGIFTAPAVGVSGGVLVSTRRQVVEPTYFGQWALHQSLWRLEPSPAQETVTLTAGPKGAVVDQVVVDTKWVEITCPSDLVLEADPGQCSNANVTYAGLPAVDGCIVTNVSCDPPNGSSFPVGTTPVTCTVVDGSGRTLQCNFTVTVRDTEGPVLACPEEVTVPAEEGQCDAAVTYSVSATDNCPGATVVCEPASGSRFPIGQTTVNCTATDASGNTAGCSFKVTIQDTQLPILSCPADLTVPAEQGQCSAQVTYTATAVDNCPGATWACEPASGSQFSVGRTVVVCTAIDAAGNSAQCSFVVTVADAVGPQVCAAPPESVAQGGTEDDFTGPEPATPSPALRSLLFGLDLRGYDEGCADAFFATTLSNLPSHVVAARLRLRLRACEGFPENDTIILGFVRPTGEMRPERWTRRLGALDTPGLLDSAWTNGRVHEFVLDLARLENEEVPPTDLLPTLNAVGQLDLIVQDDTLVDYAVLELEACACGSNVVVMAEPGACGATVNYPWPAFVDPCDGTNFTVVCQPPPGSYFGLGYTEVHCTATDPHGNQGRCAFAVVVEPNPDLVPRLSIRAEAGAGSPAVVISWPVTCLPNWRLEQTDSLWPPIAWQPVTEPAVIEDGRWAVRQLVQPGHRFYRLRAD